MEKLNIRRPKFVSFSFLNHSSIGGHRWPRVRRHSIDNSQQFGNLEGKAERLPIGLGGGGGGGSPGGFAVKRHLKIKH